MGASANQVKPVRILDAPIKQKFFFRLLEPGQEIPDLYFLKNKIISFVCYRFREQMLLFLVKMFPKFSNVKNQYQFSVKHFCLFCYTLK